jgi:predicted  nucleic acid-binding Zn-ribbon protein
MLPVEEVQKRLDEQFSGEIKILEYNGQLEKNKYKCLKCGLIFTQQHTCLIQSRGCPKCDKNKSNGEKYIAKLLEQKGIKFEEQVGVTGLPLQHFDFGIYDENNLLLYFIEVQGEQHREEREIFRDSLAKIQERDERKRKYCRENNIPLYELIYQKGKFKNLDILPF